MRIEKYILKIFDILFAPIISYMFKIQLYCYSIYKIKCFYKEFDIHPTVKFYQPNETLLKGNITIGQFTYLNKCMIETGTNSKIIIGSWCAVGYNSYILADTHNTIKPTGPLNERSIIEKDIIIGDCVWIGANTYIREGIIIGNNAIIGANSVVTKNVPDNAIVGGVPARIIRIKNSIS